MSCYADARFQNRMALCRAGFAPAFNDNIGHAFFFAGCATRHAA